MGQVQVQEMGAVGLQEQEMGAVGLQGKALVEDFEGRPLGKELGKDGGDQQEMETAREREMVVHVGKEQGMDEGGPHMEMGQVQDLEGYWVGCTALRLRA
jgi:hypothetical protein